MFKRIFFSLLFCAIGILIARSGYQDWQGDPVCHYHPAFCTVIDHAVALDEKRWKGNLREALRVDTQAMLNSGRRRELTVQEFFSKDDSAWKFIDANPNGTEKRCLVSESGNVAVWDDSGPSRPMVVIIIGSLIFATSLAWPFYLHRVRVNPVWIISLFCSVFFLAGIAAASGIWPEIITHIQASRWELTPYVSLGTRTFRSGKSTHHEQALQYDFQGKTYVTVKGDNSFPLGTSHDSNRVCRVNPAQPRQVALSWGWRPGLGVALFPVPFLAVGLLAVFISFSPTLQRQIKEGNRLDSRRRNHASLSPKEQLWGTAFVLIFIGSIVGVFVSCCAQMWMDAHPEKWIFTIFLIPFVIWVLHTARSFARAVWRMMNPAEQRKSVRKS